MSKSKSILLFMILQLAGACQEPFFTEEPGGDHEAIFQQVWKDFNTTYPAFAVRKVNWDSVYQIYSEQAAAAPNKEQLFLVLSSMLASLKDGHAGILSGTKYAGYDIMKGRHPNFLGLGIRPRLSDIRVNRTFLAGKLPENIGYIYIGSWGNAAGDYAIIDPIINSMRTVKGLIIDVRNNSGGSNLPADEVAGRLVDQRRIATYIRYKNGAAHENLTSYIPLYIEPEGPLQLTGLPMIVLTNRACYSANEHFIAAMRVLPYVKTLGDTTGGGSSSPLWKELPNGWFYRLPRWLQYDVNKVTFEGSGIFPDYPVWISKADSAAGRDTILEEAIIKLK